MPPPPEHPGKGLALPPMVVPLQRSGHREADGGHLAGLTLWILVEACDVHAGVAAHSLGADAPPNLLRV